MKNTNFRTAFLAATAAVLLIPAANAGGLGGALGGAVGGTMGGTLGGSFGNSMGTIGGGGSADGFGQGRLGAPDLGRPIGRVRDTGDRVTEHGKAATGKVRDRASDAKSSAVETKNEAASNATSSSTSQPAPAASASPRTLDPSFGTEGVLGGSAGAETRRHEALLDAGSAGSAHADRSGADASVSPNAAAKAGRKAPPAPSTDATPAQ